MASETEILLELIRQHSEADTRRFEEVNKKLDNIDTTMTSLVETRALAQGAWKATTLLAGLVAGVVSAAVGVVGWALGGH